MSRAICIASQFSMPFLASGPVNGSSTPILIGSCLQFSLQRQNPVASMTLAIERTQDRRNGRIGEAPLQPIRVLGSLKPSNGLDMQQSNFFLYNLIQIIVYF
jgi:hypothetical protein